MADRYDDRSDNDAGEGEPSVFDLFEPPPTNDPNTFGKVPVIKDAEVDLTDGLSPTERKAAADVEAAGLQHWTAPPTGQVPAVLSEKEQKSGMWGDVAGPSWHGDDPTWSGPDLADVFADAESIRLDSDEEDDEEEEDEHYRRATPPPPRARLADPAPTADPPIAAAPGRRPPPAEQSWPGDAPDGALDRAPDRAPAPAARHAPAPRVRRDPDGREAGPAPAPRPGAADDRQTWPTSPDHRSRPDMPAAGTSTPSPRPGPPHRTSVTGEHELDGLRDQARRGQPRSERRSMLDDEGSVPSIDDIEFADPPKRIREPASRSRVRGLDRDDRGGRGRRDERLDREPVRDDDFDLDLDEIIEEGNRRSGRNLPAAIGVGVALVALLLAAMRFGPETTLLLVVVAAIVGVVELYNAMRLAGLRPANLLGIVGTAAAPAAAYYRGDAALPLIIGLTVVFGSLWYLVGADTERPVLNLSLTMMGIFWIGGLAAFAGLMLRSEGGVELLLAAIIITVVSDTMAYVGGRAYGRRPFHPASPNKTWEGTTTGFLAAVFAGFAIGITEMGTLWDGNLLPAIALGAVVGLLAPIGDLAESVVKRDLGIKDMGTLLPGHGGVLDRVDALLFALPGAYYVGLVSGLI
ncbi:MAG: phosphatidate cytidylyltransferase [Actinomycetota bacterium]